MLYATLIQFGHSQVHCMSKHAVILWHDVAVLLPASMLTDVLLKGDSEFCLGSAEFFGATALVINGSSFRATPRSFFSSRTRSLFRGPC